MRQHFEFIVSLHDGVHGNQILTLEDCDGGGTRIAGPKCGPYSRVCDFTVQVSLADLEAAHLELERRRAALRAQAGDGKGRAS